MGNHCCSHNHSHSDHQTDTVTGPIDESWKKTVYQVAGMDCADEVAAIQQSLRFPGIHRVDANLIAETVTIFHSQEVGEKKLREGVLQAGVKIIQGPQRDYWRTHKKRVLLIAFSGIALLLALLLSTPFISVGLYALSIILAGTLVFPKALLALRNRSLDMNVLMTIAVIGAVVLQEYSEAASVVFLFALAELLESMSIARARKAIKEVLKVAPQMVTVVEGATSKEIFAELLRPGMLVLVKPGENIPVDGIIAEGQSTVNQAALTGESVPVAKSEGDSVWAGTLNEIGVLKVKAEKEFSETKIAKVVAMVEEAQAQKAPSQRFVDRFSAIYTPAVLVIALLLGTLPPLLTGEAWEPWIYKALVFLVIGCPCALVISTPVSVVSGLTSLARRGVLVKGGVHLESLGRVKAVAVDKTGTITEGAPRVQAFRSFVEKSESEMLRITASLESMSTHPLARAILSYADEKEIVGPHPNDYRNVPGRGAEGLVDGHWYFVGNHAMAHEMGICTPAVEQYLAEVESRALSVVVLGHRPHENCAGEIWGVFSVGDTIRSNATTAIQELHRAEVSMIAMLSGDNQRTVTAVAEQVGIDFAKGDLLPQDKVEQIKELVSKYQNVAMVGDGINDGPALAHATLGIAMGVAGSDTAIETADVALMKDDLQELPRAIKQGKRVLGVIRFNIFFAIAIKLVFFVLAFFGLANLWMAVASDMGASLLVTFNALRLLSSDQRPA